MSSVSLLEKIKNYKEDWCYQYQKRIDTLQEDMEKYHWTKDDIESISLDDFEFSYIDSKEDKKEATEFIKRYEWLGTIGSYPTHWFTARYKGILGGVVIMGMPNVSVNYWVKKPKILKDLFAEVHQLLGAHLILEVNS